MHWSVKLIMGLGIIGTVTYLLPILDLFEMFLYVVVVPVMVLYAFGLVGKGTLEAIEGIGPSLKNDLIARVEAYRAAIDTETRTAAA